MKNTRKNLPVGTAIRRNAQKGNSTPRGKKTRSARRYFEVKVRISAEDYARGQPYFDDEKYLSKFLLDAYTEKVNRSEANCKSARLRILASNTELLLPVIKEMHSQGMLNFLKETSRENIDG